MAICTLTDGGKLHYHMTNASKPPVLMIHGWTGCSANWIAQRNFLRHDYNVITPDMRGHGKSSKERGLTIGQFAQDLHALVDELQLEKFTLAGHSMGALISLEYIRQFGQGHIDKLILVDQSPRLLTDSHWKLGIYGNFTTETNRRFIEGLMLNFNSTMISFDQNGLNDDLLELAKHYSGPFFFSKEVIPEVMIDIWHSIIAADFRDLLSTITIPVLLFHGRKSQFYSLETAYYMKTHLTNAEVAIFEQSRHSPQLEEAHAFNDVLGAFLTK